MFTDIRMWTWGVVPVDKLFVDFGPEDVQPCPDCDGKGGIIREIFGRMAFATCTHCAGAGIIPIKEDEDGQGSKSI